MSTTPDWVRFGKKKWLFWLLMNLLSIAASSVILFGGLLYAALSVDLTWGLDLILTGTWVGALAGLAAGLLIGVAQWLVIRRHVPRAFHWVWKTAIGSSIGYAGSLTLFNAFLVLGDPIDKGEPLGAVLMIVVELWLGLILGTAIAVMQWTILRRVARGARRWIGANGLAWAPGLYIAIWPRQTLVNGGYLTLLLYGSLGGLLVGAVTGLVLLWLLNHQEQNGDHSS
jgi:hypothetical protein